MPYLIDLDGTIYCGKNPLPQSAGFVRWMNEKKIPYRFVTNAPENHPEDIEARLRTMGIPVQKGSVITCAMMAADCLATEAKKRQIRRVRVLGDQYLKDLVMEKGFILDENAPDCVIISMDKRITVGEIQDACCQIREGALFIATNPDDQIPSERGLIPHTGMMVRYIADCTGIEPVMAGKPSAATKDDFPALFGCRHEDIAVIGDRLDTDMSYGTACGYKRYLVLTGFADQALADSHPDEWDEVFADLDALMDWEEKR